MNPILKHIYDAAPVAVQELLLSTFSRQLGHGRYGGRFSEFQALLEESQWWDARRMGEWQDQQLRLVISHAAEHVPYYRELFDLHNINPKRFRGREDLARIPLLTRETVKRRRPDLLSRRAPNWRLTEGHTSGTTGSPLTVFFHPDMVAMNYAAMDRQYRWLGQRLGAGGDRVAVLRGNPVVAPRQSKPPFWRHNRHLNQLLLSSFHLKDSNAPAYLQALRSFQPAVLDGYPSSLYVLAKLLSARGERLPLRAVVTSSETLYDFQRDAIESTFECRVFDYYAAAERVIFAVECDAHQGHHFCQEYGITEVVHGTGAPLAPDTEGFLAGTTLHNLAMPLIRYLTTDRSAIRSQQCACGRPAPLMRDVTTKAEDLLCLKDGRLIPPSVLTHPFKPLDSIDESQLVQTDTDRLIVRLVPRAEYRDEHGQTLIRDLKARLGDDMRVNIELMPSLPRTASGKFKWVICEVDHALKQHVRN